MCDAGSGYGGCGGGYYGGGYYGGYRGYAYGNSPYMFGGYGMYGYSPYSYGYGSTGYSYVPSGPTYGPSYSSNTYNAGTNTYATPMGSLVIRVPAENAEIWVDGAKTQQRGMTRNFQFTYPSTLENATYKIKARWQGDNGEVVQTRTVRFNPSQPVNVDFRTADLAAAEEQEQNGSKTHTGTFVSASGQNFVMEQNGKQHTHSLADNARVYDDAGKQCNITELKNGQRIRVTTKEGDNKTATKVEALKKN